MKFPKLVIASSGRCTCALLDGVFLAEGIGRLDFSTHQENGEMKNTIRVLDLDVGGVDFSKGPQEFSDFIEKMTESEEARRKNATRYFVCECGKKFHRCGAKFCSDCGRKLEESKTEPAPNDEAGV